MKNFDQKEELRMYFVAGGFVYQVFELLLEAGEFGYQIFELPLEAAGQI